MAEPRNSSGGPRRFAVALALMLVIAGALMFISRPGDDIAPVRAGEPPVFERDIVLARGADTLAPFGLALWRDTLWVAFMNDVRVAALDTQYAIVRWVDLEPTTASPPLPTGWEVDSQFFYRVDHKARSVDLFERDGRLVDRWDRRPDGEPLVPFAMDLFAGNLYVGDVASGRVLAISMRNDPPLTERGELILAIPGFEQPQSPFGFISGVDCTPDGRLLVADSDPAGIHVFTCDGRAVYDFQQSTDPPQGARQAAFDGVRIPDLPRNEAFDPSNVAAIGRIHVVDSKRNLIYVYDPFGQWRFSYGSKEDLQFPNAIVAHPTDRRITVADTGNRRLVVYRW